MFGLFKRNNEAKKARHFALIERDSKVLYGYFETHEEVLEKKIVLEIRSRKAFKVMNVNEMTIA